MVSNKTKTKPNKTGKKLKLIAIAVLVLIVLAAIAVFSLQVGSKTFIVSADGKSKYTSIQQAINEASGGDIIYVKRGVYAERLTINKNIILMGEDRNGVVLKGNGSKELDYNGIYADAGKVTIDGFNVTGFGNGIYINGNQTKITNCVISNASRGVSSFASDIEVSNNVFTMIAQYAVYTSAGKNIKIVDNIVTNPVPGTQYSVYLLGCENALVKNNILDAGKIGIYSVSSNATISNNSITNNSLYGIYSFLSTSIIQQNNLAGNIEGVHIQASSKCIVSENNIIKSNHGVVFLSVSRIDYTNRENRITKNIISNGTGYGVYLDGANENNIIEGNLIDNNVAGIVIEGLYDSYQYYRINTNNQITKNIITGNGAGIMVQGFDTNSNEIKNNNINKNKNYGMDALDAKNVITAKENFWGSASGPQSVTNPISDGDKATINVNFLNWLKSEEKIDTPKIPIPTISNYPITRNFQSNFTNGFDVPFVLFTVCISVFIITRTHRKKSQI